MLIIDYLFILILLFSTIFSFIRGFIKEILTIFVWFISFYLSRKYYDYFLIIKDYTIINFYFKKIFLLFIYFLLTIISGNIVKKFLNKKIIYFYYINNFNKILGLFFGILKGYLIIFILLYSLKHIDKNLYNYFLNKKQSFFFIYFNNILQKYEYFL
ncbi:hypothetical protein GJU04_00350 [Enterobacteriaceae endosymbiont of Donacia marginata]|uniref:CvpA family protein n=1 Tax=Enterobacteriaceae endosymbiont of Donacia marginata TaxID=2675779 RepID=UPI00144A1E90|nr:CvpA family protein [Enterobacteriaceae endosymbiont of Donacia marginata]QJC38009.1 hypothetical protein GJU04_00350 [Enterobacteriaceae endosymbiont of Donacia marginata]